MNVLVIMLCLAAGDATSDKARAREMLGANPLDPAIEKLLQSAVAATPDDPEAHYLYGQWAILNHQEALAVREETRAAALSPANQLALMQAWTLVGMAEDTRDHEAAARSAFERAKAANLKLPHPQGVTLFEYAKFLQKRGKPREAQLLNARVLELSPSFAPAHLLRARLFDSAGERAEAIRAAEEALRLSANPEDERAAHAFLARAYFAMGDAGRAQPHREWIEQHGSAR